MTASIVVLLLFCLLFVPSCTAIRCGKTGWSPGPGYRCQQLADQYLVHWKVDASSNSIQIGLEIESKGPGSGPVVWAGLGISPQGGMKGASIVTISQTASKKGDPVWSLQTLYATDYAQPLAVDLPDVQLESVEVVASKRLLRAVFTRPLDACDPSSVRIDPGLPTAVIWAFSEQKGQPFSVGHDVHNRGSTYVTFSPTNARQSTVKDGQITTLALHVPPTPVPMGDFYGCLDVEFANDQPRHIIRAEAILKGSPGNVHHMILYACEGPPDHLGDATLYHCPSMPYTCLTMMLVWAPGSQAYVLPPEAGIRIGPGGYRYGTLQIHYNNVARVKNRVDMSGLKITMTTALRPHDVGIIALGTVAFSLPPGMVNISLGQSWCPSQCTQQFPHNLTVFSANLHAHMTGSSLTLRHLRGAKELRPLAQTKHYDYRFQPHYPIAPDTSIIMPGDALITECSYNTLGRQNVTRFGETSQDEMCFSFIAYWPRVPNINLCVNAGNQLAAAATFSTCSQISDVIGALKGFRNNTIALLGQLYEANSIVVGTRPAFSPYDQYGEQCRSRLMLEGVKP